MMERAIGGTDDCTHDVIIIGGGVNGTGVARDCALRGFKVALFEKNDFAFGASGNNSGMIHGGPRYLTSHPNVTQQSCIDSGYIQHIAPHLVFRIPFLFPVPGNKMKHHVVLAAVDAFFAFYDRYQPLKGGKPHTMLDAQALKTLEPGIRGDFAGAVTFDEWGIDGVRLCVLNVLDAERHGADIYNHYEVSELIREDAPSSRVRGVAAHDVLTGCRVEVRAPVVVNATGAWSSVTAQLGGIDRALVRPGKGIHVLYERRLSNYGVVAHAIDGREIFVMPWQNLSWIATTDDDYYGDLDHVTATTDEVRYLVEGVSTLLPAARDARVIATTAGVRPTLYAYGPSEDALSREHAIIDHGVTDGVAGLFSMVGGKLASYRLFSEEMADRVSSCLGKVTRCSTHRSPLPGGEEIADVDELARRFGVPTLIAQRLVYRHGRLASEVLEGGGRRASAHRVVCGSEPVIEAEVRYACRSEAARTLDDVARRTRLGLGACGGMDCAFRAATIVADECGYDFATSRRMATKFVRDRYRNRIVGMGADQLRQEELIAGRWAYSGAPTFKET